MDYGRVVDELFSHVAGVRFNVELWNGEIYEYGSGLKPAFTLVFSEEGAARRLISQGALGFGESYMDGSTAVEGDLDAYLRIRHQFKTIKPSVRLGVAAIISSSKIPKKADQQIAQHYDFGNDFFRTFLDKDTLSYSCGLYYSGRESLSRAQKQKLEYVCEQLQLPPGARVLDLGCGWGGFASYAAAKYKWHITSVTLSKEQEKYCKELFATKSLDTTVSLKYGDMLKEIPGGPYDAIVMIESIEHVGRTRLKDFMGNLYSKLAPGGVVYIQTSGRYKPKRLDRWTLKYVFPGGHLPSQQELVDYASSAGFELKQFIDDRQDYIRTIDGWIRNFESREDMIIAMFDQQTYRLWKLWLHGAKIGFEMGTMGLFRIRLQRPSKR
jgi:cyclopropane-fatty-acyl-phospholipid synthase